MPQRPKNVKTAVQGAELNRSEGVLERALPEAEAGEDRHSKIDAAAKDFMSKNANLLKKLAE